MVEAVEEKTEEKLVEWKYIEKEDPLSGELGSQGGGALWAATEPRWQLESDGDRRPALKAT